jgi:hypothetical protein
VSNYKEKIINLKTGEETFRDYTPEEIEIAKKEEAEAAAHAAEMKKRQDVRKLALSKLIDLGLTEEEIAAL